MAAEKSNDSQKTSWPELLGKTYEEAWSVIQVEQPEFEVLRVCPGQPMTRDYKPDRVRVMVDDIDVIIQVPSIG